MRFPDFPVESGVPMPEDKQRYDRYKYPWRVMEVGDSFFVPAAPDLNGDLPHSYLKLHRLRALISYQHRKHPEHFEVRVVDGGVRVWRTK